MGNNYPVLNQANTESIVHVHIELNLSAALLTRKPSHGTLLTLIHSEKVELGNAEAHNEPFHVDETQG
ncbi:MAG: hypothetical protein QW579_08715 [Desulfurococcaceae archaeon]